MKERRYYRHTVRITATLGYWGTSVLDEWELKLQVRSRINTDENGLNDLDVHFIEEDDNATTQDPA